MMISMTCNIMSFLIDCFDISWIFADPEKKKKKWNNKVDLVIDGGYGDNVASTIIDLTGYEPEVIREGKGSLDVL